MFRFSVDKLRRSLYWLYVRSKSAEIDCEMFASVLEDFAETIRRFGKNP